MVPPDAVSQPKDAQAQAPPPLLSIRQLGLPRQTALVVDHQNLVGRALTLGLRDFDPRWLVDLALRLGNCLGMSLVTDLAMANPATNVPYLNDIDRWSDEGFTVVHVPSRKIHVSEQGEISDDAKGASSKRRYRRKDMTDGGIRSEIQRWSMVPEVTHVLLFTHDVDFASVLLDSATTYGKKVVLLNAGNGIAQALANSAHEVINVLGYTSAYSVWALEKIGFWHPRQNLEQLGEKVWRCLATPEGARHNSWLTRQFKDAQHLIRHLTLDRLCLKEGLLPCSKRLSWRLLQAALHEELYAEKILAGLDGNVEGGTTLVSAQQVACLESLRNLMEIWQKNEVLLADNVTNSACGPHRQFYVNTDHPAVIVLTETDFP